MCELNKEIYNNWKRSATIPEWWELCRICNIPFKTDTFAQTCNRCSVLVDFRVKLFHSILVRVLIFLIIYIVISLYLILYILNYTHAFYFLLLPPFFLGLILGKILYWVLLKLDVR
jgi:hypothetical protein